MSAGPARLQHALKTLQEQWEIARESWDDQVARDFETHHLVPLDHMVKHAARGMQAIAEVLARVRNDCSDAR